MGCGASNDRPPSPCRSPVTTPVFAHVDNDDWMFYAPRYAHQCCACCFDRPRTSSCTDSRCYTSTSSHWDSSEGRMSPRGEETYSSRSYTPRSTPAHSSPGRTSHRPCKPRSTPTLLRPGETEPNCRPSLGPASSATYTSRSYSLLSTPTFYSPSSHPKNDLTLDPTLFSNNLSPFADAACANKIDTDCASRFSGSSRSSLSAFTSPTSSSRNTRYPLTPLSVHTEPFPRITAIQSLYNPSSSSTCCR